MSNAKPTILLTGATGYVGGRLLPRLLSSRYSVRCAVRNTESLSRFLDKGVEVVKADLLDADSVAAAMDGVQVAYYLAHSLGSAVDFEEKERR